MEDNQNENQNEHQNENEKENKPEGKSENPLTPREIEVLKYVIDGKSNTEIAATLVISQNTAKAHVSSILNKLDVEDRVQAAVKAIREGLID